MPYPNQNEPNTISKPAMVDNTGYPVHPDSGYPVSDDDDEEDEGYFAPIYETTEPFDDMPRNLPLREYETDFYSPGYVLIKPPRYR